MSEQTTAGAAVVECPAFFTEVALVDFSSIAFPLWTMSGAQPDPDWTSTAILDRVRALTAQHPKAAICCDSRKSFRKELDPEYKAQREAAPAAYYHQVSLAKERLEAEGYPIWTVDGFEADDLIASATSALLALDVLVLVISADKDLLQLVGPKVRALSPASGKAYDEAAVVAKFGVFPSQVCDYLTLVGDASDNVKGAAGIGPKKAAALLAQFNTLEILYSALPVAELGKAIKASLVEFEPRWRQVRELVALRYDVPLSLGDLDRDRSASAPALEDEPMSETTSAPVSAATIGGMVGETSTVYTPAPVAEAPTKQAEGGAPIAGELVTETALAPAPAEWGKQLEPRSMGEAAKLARYMQEARMFQGYGSAQAVLSTILAGRELGLQAVASLRGFHIVDGKHALAADAMRGLVLRSGQAKYFRVIERTAEIVTFETWRKDEPEPFRMSYTIAEARIAYGFASGANEKALAELEGKWQRSTWVKHPADMLAARCSSKLARLVYSDIIFGLYSPEELRD